MMLLHSGMKSSQKICKKTLIQMICLPMDEYIGVIYKVAPIVFQQKLRMCHLKDINYEKKTFAP